MDFSLSPVEKRNGEGEEYHPSSRPLTAPLCWAKVCTYHTMHDSDALGSLSLQYVSCVFGLKHYLTLKEGFRQILHLLSCDHPVSPTGIEFLLILRYMNFCKQSPGYPFPYIYSYLYKRKRP